MSAIKFTITKTDSVSRARAGVISTPHGVINTPAFIPVGTKATVKALTPAQVIDVGAEAVLANTYHLYFEPGAKTVADLGGLHQFMNWPRPIITDSGGFQAFSLGVAWGQRISKVATSETKLASAKPIAPAKISDAGIDFKSPQDGSWHQFTPEISMAIQHQLGADIIMAFDECTAPTADYAYQQQALDRTHAWAKRCLDYHVKQEAFKHQGLFGIVQGGRFADLRHQSAAVISQLDFAGFGIGGSFNKEDLATAVGWVTEVLPATKPKHLLGIGQPVDLWAGVEQGIDTFDCVIPTREARNGSLYTAYGRLNIYRAEFKQDARPIASDCSCYTCRHFSRAYLAHLFRSKEMLAATLASIHNLTFIIGLVGNIRQAILDDRFAEAKAEFLARYS